ncbi:MAG: folate-binding protein YgfZ [Gammaproteobacteria bacterium]|nr:MAG: folate-binding protein YgfZ [Gammaproteobacteria bacterium]
MNPDWQKFIESQGGIFDVDGHARFGDLRTDIQTAQNSTIITDLSCYAQIHVQGEDMETFLQGQFTNDIRLIDENHSQLSAYCTPKGRMLALFRIWRTADGVTHLLLPGELQEGISKRLRIYVMRAKVTLEHAENMVQFGLTGPKASQILKSAGIEYPETVDACNTTAWGTVIAIAGPTSTSCHRFLISGPTHQLASLWKKCVQQGAAAVSSQVWHWMDIHAGLPSVVTATSEAFIPQMANLDLIQGVNFKKGCYPGQEIVARMQYLGKLKQRMYRFSTADERGCKPGDTLYAHEFGEQSAGTIVEVQPAPGGGMDILAITQIKAIEGEGIYFDSGYTQALKLQELPYKATLPACKM